MERFSIEYCKSKTKLSNYNVNQSTEKYYRANEISEQKKKSKQPAEARENAVD